MKYKVALIGDLIFDKFIYYQSIKLSPEGPAPIVKKIRTAEAAGGAGNVAASLANLGLDLKFYFPFSKKDSTKVEELIIKLFKNIEIKREKIFTDLANINPIKIRYYVDDRQYMREDNEINNLNKISVISNELIDQIVFNHDIIVVADYQKGCFDSDKLSYLIKTCNNLSKPLFIDTKNKNIRSVQNAFCLKINKKEFNYLFKKNEILEEQPLKLLKDKIKEARLNSNIKNLIVTLGSEGCIASTEKDVIFCPAVISDVIDITGAGDAFISALVYSFLNKAFERGQNPFFNSIAMDNINFANSGASSVVSKKGTLPLDKDFKLSNFKEKEDTQIIGFTNGCFDIIHDGHLSLFEEAKKHCDYLIVGLNSDSSIKRLKGEKRPINDQYSRLNLLNSLKSIDEVILFNEDTPEQLIEKIKPHILIKGADYKTEEIVGSNFVKSYGGKVIRTKLIENKSSTNLIEKIRNL